MEKVAKIFRAEPDRYCMTFFREDEGTFVVECTSVEPVTLTLRVEDAWNQLPVRLRHLLYKVSVTDEVGNTRILDEVVPDARIQFDLKARVTFTFVPRNEEKDA